VEKTPLTTRRKRVVQTFPSVPLNLDRIDYETARLSRPELMELVHGLFRKGLVRPNLYDGGLLSLILEGNALEIRRTVGRGE